MLETTIRHDGVVTDTPTSSTSGRGEGHALFRGAASSEVSGPSDNLLVTPHDPREFKGRPYPAPGIRVYGTAGNPPWLVVHHSIDRVGVSQWPVRLWRVRHIEPAPAEHQMTEWYTRAISMEIVEEVPRGVLFGDNGAAVATVIDAAHQLREEDVLVLAAARRQQAALVYREVWQRWADLGYSGSPVGHALVLIDHGVDRAAKRVGRSLFRFDPRDEVEVLSDDAWVAAKAALLEAAIGVGAADIKDRDERALLTAAWRHWATSR